MITTSRLTEGLTDEMQALGREFQETLHFLHRESDKKIPKHVGRLTNSANPCVCAQASAVSMEKSFS